MKVVVLDGVIFVDGGDGYFCGDVWINCMVLLCFGGCGSFMVLGMKIIKIVFDVVCFGLSFFQMVGLDVYVLGVIVMVMVIFILILILIFILIVILIFELELKFVVLMVLKVVDKVVVVFGDILDYIIIVFNIGEVVVYGVFVIDIFLFGLIDVIVDQGGVIVDGWVFWIIDSILVGEQIFLYVIGIVDWLIVGLMFVNCVVVKNFVDVLEKMLVLVFMILCIDDVFVVCVIMVVIVFFVLLILKVVDKQVVGYGELFFYILVVVNFGIGVVVGVFVVDMLFVVLIGVIVDQGGVVDDGVV